MNRAVSLRHLGVTPRARFGLGLHAVVAAALVPAHILFQPTAGWEHSGLIALLAALAVIAFRHSVPLPSGITFDARVALALIAVALVGPLPALVAVFVVPVTVNALSGRERLLRAGNLANLAAYGWYTLAGGLVIAASGSEPGSAGAFGVLAAAGCLQLIVNFAVGPLVYATLWVGHPLRSVARMFPDGLPAGVAMTTLGALTALLYPHLGLLALGLFALVAVVPQSALTFAARTRPVAQLDPLTATRRYAHALALHLGLNRTERRHLARVTQLAFARRAEAGDPIAYARQTLRDPSRASWEAGHVGEWWNGGGGPAGLRGPVTPMTARIVAVADTWSALTARGGPRLSHADALEELENAAGTRFDPRVVQAAYAVVAEERVSEREPAPVPRLHALRVPAPLRRAIALAE